MVKIFKNDSGRLKIIKEKPFNLEKDMQKLIENNIEEIFNLQLIRGTTKGGEFELKGLRIDSLCFDPDSKSFVIIEFKKDRNFSVIDQGFTYLSLLLNNKADFILEFGASKKDEIEWSQSRVIFIAPSFTEYQKQSINFRDLPFELWEITSLENNNISLDQIKSSASSESINKIMPINSEITEIQKEIKVYQESDHLAKPSEKIKELYEELKTQLLNMGPKVEISPQKKYIAFKAQTNFVDLELQKDAIKCHLNMKKGNLDDPKKIARDVSNIGHYGNGEYEVIINSSDEIPYFLSLIKQSHNKNS